MAPQLRVRAPRPGRTRLLILSAPRTSNQFVSVYPALVAIPRTARESHAFLQRIVRLIEMENMTERPGREAVMRRLAELTVIELVRFALPRLPRGGRPGSAVSRMRTSDARSQRCTSGSGTTGRFPSCRSWSA